MIVYNTTFHIDTDILNDTLVYLKKYYIPAITRSGLLNTPCLRRVMHTSEEEGSSYAIQFYVKDMQTLNNWLENEGMNIHQELINRFGNKITGFTTLLEDIDWEK